MSLVKYRVKEVAADFGMQAKEIAEIVGMYFEKPKSNSQVLTDEQLNVLFDHITQKNQIESIAQVFATAAAPKAEPKAEPKAAEPKQEAAKQEDTKPQQEQRKRERRVVDTKAVTVNADRFDDRVDSLVSERVPVSYTHLTLPTKA